MDTDRISIARVLALGVPLTWEDAVAVAHQAAMLIEVDSVMSDQPLLVTAESCLISRAGHLDCTSVTDQAAPDAVLTLLRRMLDGSDPPPEIAALAAEGATPDIYGALDSIAVGNRHARIAELAARALAPPADVAAPAAVAPPPRPVATPKPAALSETAPESAPVAKPPPVPTPAPVPVQAGSSLAAGAMLVVSTRDTDGPSTGGHDAEFRRLRTRALLKPGRHGIGALRRRSLDLNLSPASRRRVAGVAAVVIGVLIPVGWLVARADRVEVPALPASPLAVPKALAAKSVAQAMAAAAAPQRPATPVRSAPTSNMLVAVPQPVNPPLAISRVPQLAASVPYVSARPDSSRGPRRDHGEPGATGPRAISSRERSRSRGRANRGGARCGRQPRRRRRRGVLGDRLRRRPPGVHSPAGAKLDGARRRGAAGLVLS